MKPFSHSFFAILVAVFLATSQAMAYVSNLFQYNAATSLPRTPDSNSSVFTSDAADKLISSSVRYGQGADSTPHIEELFSYDGNGALTNWISNTNTLSFSYDALGQVAKVAQTFLSAFSYDALGNRVVMDGKYFIPDHSDPLKRPLMECDTSGNVLRYYIWGDNRLLGFIDANNTLTVAHSDDFGSVIALTDLSGNLFYTANYGPHGEDWGSVGVNPTPFTWLGGYGVQYLETDTPLRLYLTRHRVYSATLNRFLSPDPLGLEGGLNFYQYAEGNPLSYIDPFGLCAQTIGGAAWQGFKEGLPGGFSTAFNSATFGLTDYLGWTDSSQYQGWEYDVSRGLATVGGLMVAQAGWLAATEVAGTALVNWGAGAAGVAGGAGAVARTPNFIVSSGGTIYPVPQGATGPLPVATGRGFQYIGGSGGHGLSPAASSVRIMDPVLGGKYPYPSGYGSYLNQAGQTINPVSGQTISPSNPWWHIPQ